MLSRHLVLWHTGDENLSDSTPLQQLRNFPNRLFMLLFLILMKNRIKSSAVQIFLLSPFCCDQLCQILFRDAVIHRTSKPFGRKLGPKTALFKRLSKRRKSRHADHKIGTRKQRRLMLCRHLARQMFCPVRLDQGQICFFPCSLKQLLLRHRYLFWIPTVTSDNRRTACLKFSFHLF